MITRTCALDECSNVIETDNTRKKYCSREHMNLDQQRRWRNRHRKGKGGNGGGGNGGGGGESPTLFDTITPVNSDTFVPLPVIGPNESERRPARSEKPRPEAKRAAA